MTKESYLFMKQRGSITVFLSLIMVILFSMILTTLEAARIQGASAYLSVLTELSEDSFLASYYYPLFQEYRLFGVDAGAGTAYFSEDFITEKLENNITYALSAMEGGMFHWEESSAELTSYNTMLTNQGTGFLAQVKEQAVLEGISLAVQELFDAQTLQDAALAGDVYEQQEEALEAVSTVTKEVLQLMELVDGIKMSDQGLGLDAQGRLQTAGSFVKQILPMNAGEFKTMFENEEVYRTIAGKLLNPVEKAKEIKELIKEAKQLEVRLAEYDKLLRMEPEDMEEWKRLREERDELVEHLDLVWMDAQEQYDVLQDTFAGVKNCLDEAEEVLIVLEKKQAAARPIVEKYAGYLEGRKEQLSEELYQVFEQELHTMKLYLGMEEEGYSTSVMQQSIAVNQSLLNEAELSGFAMEDAERMLQEMEQILRSMPSYTANGLWFTYGTIVAGEPLPGNLWKTLGTLLTSTVLDLAGVKDVSKRELSGEELPSEGKLGQPIGTGIKDSMRAVKEMILQGEWNCFLEELSQGVTDKAALEVYCSAFFGDYTEPLQFTRLFYEREYLIFGQKKDAQNLLSAVLAILAVRLLFSIVGTLKNPERMAQLQSFAIGLVGFTGIPALISAVQYSLLFLWALEESFIEVSAMLLGKRIAIFPGEGQLVFAELFQFSKAMVRQKAEQLQDTVPGAGYGEYLALFSLLLPIKRQEYHAMDLIQENIRYRYRTSFRMRNTVIAVDGTILAVLKKKYNTGLFPDKVYTIKQKVHCGY